MTEKYEKLSQKVKRYVATLKQLRYHYKSIIINLDKQIDYLEHTLTHTNSIKALVDDLKKANLQIKDND